MEIINKIIIYINKNIFIPIDVEIKIDILIGIIGVLISVVIFVAETMNSSKNETEKRLILKETKILNIMIYSIIVLVLCLLKEIVPINITNIENNQKLYFITQLIINFLVAAVIVFVIKLFCISIKLNVDSTYKFNQYNIYIKNRLDTINERINKTSSKTKKDKSSENLIKKNEYFSYLANKTKNMIPIKSQKSGIFIHYRLSVLKEIINVINDIDKFRLESKINNYPIVIFTLKNSGRITKGEIVAYCNEEYSNLSNLIVNSLEFDDSIPYQDSEMDLILNDIFSSAELNIYDGYDTDDRIYNLFKYMYENNMIVLLSISYNYLQTVITNRNFDGACYKEVAMLLNKLLRLAYSNKNVEHYKLIYEYLNYCYLEWVDNSDDARDVTFEYTEYLLRFNIYSIKHSSNAQYYDILMANLLSFVFKLIDKGELVAVDDIFKNALYRFETKSLNKLDDFQIINMQFSFGFIYGLIIMSRKDKFSDDRRFNKYNDILKTLIENVNNYFVETSDHIQALKYFIYYYSKDSEIYNTYRKFDLEFERVKYRNSWENISIPKSTIISHYIQLFNIQFSNTDNEDIPRDITVKENLSFYQNILKEIESETKPELIKMINDNFYDHEVKRNLNYLIRWCEIDENEYIRINKLDTNKIYNFKERIIDKITEGNDLLFSLKNEDRFLYSKKRSKMFLGYNQIIDREIFFENSFGYEDIAKTYADGILNGINREFISKLDNISTIMENVSIESINEYFARNHGFIIADHEGKEKLRKIGILDNNLNNTNEKYKIINVDNLEYIYLIYDSSLPTITMLDIENNDKEFEVFKNIAIRIIDCSEDEKTINNICDNAKWLKEIGTPSEQKDYLKKKCLFKLFVAPSYEVPDNAKCIKISVDNS